MPNSFDLIVSRATVRFSNIVRYSLPLIKKAYIAAIKGGDIMDNLKPS